LAEYRAKGLTKLDRFIIRVYDDFYGKGLTLPDKRLSELFEQALPAVSLQENPNGG
jgi:hypothetical protein